MAKSVANFMFAEFVRQIRPTLREIAYSKFLNAKEWLLNAVETHPVSIDMRSHGPSPLLGGSSTGTLFGFLGMEQGSDPVRDLLAFLDQAITYQDSGIANKRGLYSARVSIPSKGEMAKAGGLSPSWTGVSWPVLVEDGVNGLEYYLNKPWPKSVSGEGFQADNVIRETGFQPTDFITPLIADFRSQLLLRS